MKLATLKTRVKTRAGKAGAVFAAASLLFVLAMWALPLTAHAADTEIYDIDVTASLHEDGSASMTEVWDVNCIGDMTEWYITKQPRDYVITNLSVTDETGKTYETVDDWDINGSIEEKAGKCGILETSDGYELCWGIGSFGKHTFTVTYEMTNLVRSLDDADAVNYMFITDERDVSAEHAKVTVRRDGVEFTKDNTGVWAFGSEGMPYGVEDGVVVCEATDGLASNARISLLLEFDKGMFAPASAVDMTFGDALEEAKRGSNFGSDYNGDGGGYTNAIERFMDSSGPYIIFAIIIFVLFFTRRATKGGGAGAMGQMKKEYRDVSYSREFPYGGSLPATYTRLQQLHQLPNEGTVIGAYLLRWIRSHQVDLVTAQGGFFGNKEETAIRLYDARDTMDTNERELYNMLVKAAGQDWVLQNKEFERWAKNNYATVQGWLERYRNTGSDELRRQGAIEDTQKSRFGIPYTVSQVSPLGDQMTIGMLGFKKYLKDFTIINERQAREVQLWDEYLVFAQVFGMADEVAAQFKQLYPDYFVKMAQDLGMRPDVFDIIILTNIANSYGRAAYDGYRAGYNAHVSRDSGGGGFSSGGGGFTSFGGGGGGAGGR